MFLFRHHLVAPAPYVIIGAASPQSKQTFNIARKPPIPLPLGYSAFPPFVPLPPLSLNFSNNL